MFSHHYKYVQGKIFAIDCQGRYGVLGGKKNLFLADLDNCSNEQCLIPLRDDLKNIEDAMWSPHNSNSFVIAASEVVELWERTSDGIFHTKSSFHGHTRPICNLDWSPVCVNSIVTCSSDCFTYILDGRDFKKPSIILQSTLPPSQAKWNKINEMMLATAHEGGIEIWDLRNAKNARPSILITAHPRMINDFDWSPNVDNQMITCSMDSTVKIWNIYKPKEDRESALTLSRVVTRLKYTPFGNAMVMQCIPQKMDDDLYLWKMNDKSVLENGDIYSFPHSGRLHSWNFRKNGKDAQLIGWNDIGMLQFWKIDPCLRKLCESSESQIISVKEDESYPETLLQEFELLEDSINGIEVEKKSASERILIICAKMKKELLKLEIKFPLTYPNSVSPEFILLEPTSLDVRIKKKLIEELLSTANSNVRYNHCCVDSCLRVLITFLGNIVKQELDLAAEVTDFSKEKLSGENVPFPRTSGARFCGPGFLVCFTRRMWMEVDDHPLGLEDDENRKTNVSEGVEVTPRAMSALAKMEVKPRRPTNVVNLAKSFPSDTYIPSISLFFEIKDQEPGIKRSRSAKSTAKKTLGPVIVYDLSCLSPIQKQLGENYIFDDNPFDMCEKNSQVALACARKDLYQVWSLLAHQVAEIPSKEDSNQIFSTPFGKNLIKTWYDHYSKLKDVQTLAMISCVLSHCKQIIKKEVDEIILKENFIIQKCQNKSQRKHSNSFSDSRYDAARYLMPASPIQQSNLKDVVLTSEFLLGNRGNGFIKIYSNVLFQWGFVNKRAELLNFLSLTNDCKINDGVVGAKSNEICSLCHIRIRGPYVFCFECGHGGHVTHLSDWFSKHDNCPTGCGCICLIDAVATI